MAGHGGFSEGYLSLIVGVLEAFPSGLIPDAPDQWTRFVQQSAHLDNSFQKLFPLGRIFLTGNFFLFPMTGCALASQSLGRQ
jgi:hypothetical protein